MKKMGSHIFYENVDLNLKFDFNDLMEFFKKTTENIKKEFLDEDESLKMDLIEKYVEKYVDDKVKEKYGDNFSLDVMDDAINISWDIKVNSIKERHIESWWNKDQEKLNIEKLKKENPIQYILDNPHLIPYGDSSDKK